MAVSAEIQINPVPVGRIVVSKPCTDCEEDGFEKAGGLETEPEGLSQDRVTLSAESQEALENEEESESGGSGGVGSTDPTGQPLSEEEIRQLRQLQTTDREVRAHEQAHKAAAGAYATGGPTYEYVTGPDGKRYAVGGEVQIDTSPVPDNPEATVQKAQTIRRAALAPAEPSSQDRAVAAKASQLENQARQQIREEQQAENKERAEKAEESRESAQENGVGGTEGAAESTGTAGAVAVTGENQIGTGGSSDGSSVESLTPQQKRQIINFTPATTPDPGQLLSLIA